MIRTAKEILDDFLFTRLTGKPMPPDVQRYSDFAPDKYMAHFLQTYRGMDIELEAICASMTKKEQGADLRAGIKREFFELLKEADRGYMHPFYSEVLRRELLNDKRLSRVDVDPELFEVGKYLNELFFLNGLKKLWREGETIDAAVRGIRSDFNRIGEWEPEAELNLEFIPAEAVKTALIERAVHLQEGEVRTPEMEAAIIAAGREADLAIQAPVIRHPEKILDDYLRIRIGMEPEEGTELPGLTAIRAPIRPVLRFLREYPGRNKVVAEIMQTLTQDEREDDFFGDLQELIDGSLQNLLDRAVEHFLHPYFSSILREQIIEDEKDGCSYGDPADFDMPTYLVHLFERTDLEQLWRKGESMESVVAALRNDFDRISVWPVDFGLNLMIFAPDEVEAALLKRLDNLKPGEAVTPEMEAALQERR